MTSEPQQKLLSLLQRHTPADGLELAHLEHVRTFVQYEPACFSRQTARGHITGSAFIVDRATGALLLHHHRKLDKWLQMGGHDNGEQDAAQTALRESIEESGLSRLQLEPSVLDVDVHAIPARKDEPAHLHLDVRFLVWGDRAEPLRRDDAESLDLRWFELADVTQQMNEAGALRVVEKLKRLRKGSQGQLRAEG